MYKKNYKLNGRSIYFNIDFMGDTLSFRNFNKLVTHGTNKPEG